MMAKTAKKKTAGVAMKAEVEKLGTRLATLEVAIKALQSRVSDLENFGITVLEAGKRTADKKKKGKGTIIVKGVTIKKGGGFVPPAPPVRAKRAKKLT
jgi:hypothetical protein